MSEEINNKKATEIYYPDADGPVKWSDDIPADGRRTLGDWLNKLTEKNIQPVDAADSDATMGVDPSQRYYDKPEITFAAHEDVGDVVTLGPDGNASKLLYGDVLEGTARIESGKGTYLDPTAAGTGGTTLGKTSAVLGKNRWSPGASFKSEKWSNTQKINQFTAASTLGRYDKDAEGLSIEELQNVAEQLLLNAVGDKSTPFGDKNAATKNIGTGALSFTTQLGTARDSYDADKDFRPAEAIKPAKSEDRSDTDNINGEMISSANDVYILSEENTTKRTSYGVLNNHLEPFAAALPTSMILLAAIAAITSIIATIVLSMILDLLGTLLMLIPGTSGWPPEPSYQIAGSTNNPATLPKGAAFGSADYGDSGNFIAALYKFFGLPPLEGEYEGFFKLTDAATVGALEFFIGNSLGEDRGLPQIMSNSAGYYVVVVRNALRDMEQISKAASEMGGGLVGGIEGFFALIDAFTSSATFRFMLTLIQIGDRINCGEGLSQKRDNDGRVIPIQLPENAPGPSLIAHLGSTIRLKSDDPRLSYGFGVLPQIYIRPKETWPGHTIPERNFIDTDNFSDYSEDGATGLSAYGEKSVALTKDIVISKAVTVDGAEFFNRLAYVENGKIKTEFRKQLENELSTYYMPFYFHDLRTNEILPLPAFVSSIQDSFSPKYTESTSFGRMDPIQIYGGTTRKIGFSFYMVATSPEDYSALYYGINKLVSLVYPQWGGGAEMTNAAGEHFQIPYSYVQTASPLIRLRLGELFASNRTPETVRRLFGANLPSFTVGSTATATAGTSEQPTPASEADKTLTRSTCEAIHSRAKDKISPDAAIFIQVTQLVNAGGPATIYNSAGASADGNSGGAQTMGAKPFLYPAGTIVSCDSGRNRVLAAKWDGTEYKTSRKWKNGAIATGLPFEGTVVNYYYKGNKRIAPERRGSHFLNDIFYVIKPGPPLRGNDPWPYLIVPISDCTFPHGVAHQILPSPIPPFPPPPPAPTPITDHQFFKDNVLVKAMEESGGDGLAGVITSLDFDWNEATWETSQDLGRAPKYVKVTMSFSPIHDEPLGLNPDGSLRAAAYPVGKVIADSFGKRFDLPSRRSKHAELTTLELAMLEIASRLNPAEDESTASTDEVAS